VVTTLIKKAYREFGALLSHLFIPYLKVRYRGYQLKVPLIHGIRNGGYFVEDDHFMHRSLKEIFHSDSDRERVVLDIGSNMGLLLTQLKSINPEVRYIGFDPNVANVFYTQQLIEYNAFDNACVYPLALSDSTTCQTFYRRKHRLDDPEGSIEPHDDTSGLISVPIYTVIGDELFAQLNVESVDFIKIDVEGHECSVLEGLQNTIRHNKPTLFIECSQQSLAYLQRFVRQFHYNVYDDSGRYLDEFDEYDELPFGNYVLVSQ
jgi:FkbM family methyltransferase